jgi:hypothetical protein
MVQITITLKKEHNMIKVIFRVDKKCEEVIAFFPELPGTNDYYHDCLSYVHVGQHGSASMDYYIMDTRPAATHEFSALLDELQEIYEGELRVYLHMVASDAKKRKAAVENPRRITDLQELHSEFILNESQQFFADDSPSWGELADAQAKAELLWNETDNGKELKALLDKYPNRKEV